MNFETMSAEYKASAKLIQNKLVTMKAKQKSEQNDSDTTLPERIALLSSELSYLLKMAYYLDNYYQDEELSCAG